MNRHTMPGFFLAACMLSGCNHGEDASLKAQLEEAKGRISELQNQLDDYIASRKPVPLPVQYEYKSVYTVRDTDSVKSLQDTFNAHGKEGWKFIGVCMVDGTNGRVVLFSRELRPSSQAPKLSKPLFSGESGRLAGSV
ncbi:MAG: hypothetical protein VCA55_12450 [Verrucomicrobiales bacterium]